MKTGAWLCIWIALSVSGILFGQVPEHDSRNTNTPGTDTPAALPSYKNLSDWEKRKVHLRRQILSAAGLFPLPERTPLHPQIFGRIERQGYTIEKVLLETLPGYYLGGNLYRPYPNAGKHPAVLNPHGHWVYGRLENQPLDSGPTFGINLALQGYVAFAWDMVGYNDTIQTPHVFGSSVEQLWSFGPMGLQLWNSIRALDFVSSLEDVDTARIAIAGASGGATQSFLLAAIDDRLQVAAPVNMVSAIMQGGDACENAPGLRIGTNNVEIAAMFAPKPMLLVSATGDWTRNTPTVEYPAIRGIYELYGKPDNVETLQLNAPHNFDKENREAVYAFFARRLLGQRAVSQVKEKNIKVEMLQDMLALDNRQLPAGALSYEGVFEEWKNIGKKQTETLSAAVLRDRLRLVMAVEWPKDVLHQRDGEKIVLSRAGAGDRVPGIWLEGQGTPVLVLHPDGAAAARQEPTIKNMIRAHRPVLLIDAFQTGSAVAPRDRSVRHFLTFNQTDDACRVQDILTALAFFYSRQKKTVELIGFGKANIWIEFASAVAPIPVKLGSRITDFQGGDEDFIKQFFIPGIQYAGGLTVADHLNHSSAPL